MGDPALLDATPKAEELRRDWSLPLAQRAFARLIEDTLRTDAFRAHASRLPARQSLSALSADDRGPLQRWLALQLATRGETAAAGVLQALGAVDGLLGAAVRGLLPRVAGELAAGNRAA